tara:strand:- start:2221 stop:2535 length:315 start_codon:yes stop_codon:yes gene_type:complete
MNMNNNRKIILTLYKHKLKLCRKLGYVYGNWNDDYVVNHQYISLSKVKKYNTRRLCNYMLNNIRNQYKLCKYETDKEDINDCIDFGFETLKDMNKFLYKKIKLY